MQINCIRRLVYHFKVEYEVKVIIVFLKVYKIIDIILVFILLRFVLGQLDKRKTIVFLSFLFNKSNLHGCLR